MKLSIKFSILSIIFITIFIFKCITLRHEKFEYKYSFKGPYLAQRDGTVPFWSYGGSTIASEEMVRITPSLKSKKGYIWSKLPINFNWWEVELWFRVSGKGKFGADGLAFFYTSNKLSEGPVFGSADNWNGLSVFFDSFDNDGKGNNPYIMSMINDGKKSYDHEKDGIDQKLADCIFDFRNKPYPVRAKIQYYQNTLSLFFHSGNTNYENEYKLCFEVNNIFLPHNGFFGLSAATGDLADDHDVIKFLVYSLYEPEKIKINNLNDQEREKYSEEYERYKLKMDKQKNEYLKKHPNEHPKIQNEPESEYESVGEREFSQILSAQNQIYEVLKVLDLKLNEISNKQEKNLQLTGLQGNNYQTDNSQQLYQRTEINNLLMNQNELLSNFKQIKNSLNNIENSQNQKPSSIQQASQFNTQLIQETRDSVNNLRRELASIINKLNSFPQVLSLQSCPSCLSTNNFFIGILIHLFIIIIYNIFINNNRSITLKKFY